MPEARVREWCGVFPGGRLGLGGVARASGMLGREQRSRPRRRPPCPDDDAPTPPRPSDTSVHLALHALVDALDAETRWLVLQLLEAMMSMTPRPPAEDS